ncbi:hypothetical protein FGIG_11114 [Fasciola gigantica]|uniref:V-type proton ATPase subunit n=1 Tax=Fasciola gigantica TaxID=46835 RepID=A0A504YXK0_FASGI|nr:hypothetical protein FGIG_11114 [Fasciola gigantica]
MGYEVPLTVITIFWVLVGCGGPLVVPKGPNRPMIQLMLILTSVCCYLFWLMCSMPQINPLFGPQIPSHVVRVLQREWPVSLDWNLAVKFFYREGSDGRTTPISLSQLMSELGRNLQTRIFKHYFQSIIKTTIQYYYEFFEKHAEESWEHIRFLSLPIYLIGPTL